MGAPLGNKNAVGNGGGRPPIHTDPKAVDNLIADYFEWIEGESEETEEIEYNPETGTETTKSTIKWIRKPEPPTVTGLSLHLGFANKSSLYDYADKVEFSYSIKKAVSRIEKFHEIAITKGDKCVGNIFALKNFGWKDRTHHEVTGNQTIVWKEEKTYETDPETNKGT